MDLQDRRATLAVGRLNGDPAVEAPRSQQGWIEDLGPDRSAYRTTDTFSGEHAAWVVANTGEWVRAGFDSVARALRDRAEQLWAPGRAR